ncbi:O-antigen ligase family protein [Arthrobacter sp. efr-133-R2A-120]|uniref:O-antigen ligase family protein n=1 Tax=Arthrobacter sp. efr-133-R2A-120 TaxID=3040277 RepID=UPI00254FBDE4|nr:O-antigen ligase family protein [Arthrobacter sp. efr-133-R2A-120]
MAAVIICASLACIIYPLRKKKYQHTAEPYGLSAKDILPGLGLFGVMVLAELFYGGNPWNGLALSGLTLWSIWRGAKENPRATYNGIIIAIYALLIFSAVLAVVSPALATLDPIRLNLLPDSIYSVIGNRRLAGITDHPNTLGFIAAAAIVLTLNNFKRQRLLRTIGILFAGIILILSESRSAILGVVVAALALSVGKLIQIGDRRLRLLLVSLAVTFAGGLWMLSTLLVSDEADGRSQVWSFVIDNWAGSPIIGHGPGGLNRAILETGSLPVWASQAHNQFFNTLYAGGLAGVFFLILFVLRVLLAGIRSWKLGQFGVLAVAALYFVRFAFESPLALSGLSWGPVLTLISFGAAWSMSNITNGTSELNNAEIQVELSRKV